MNKIQIIGAPLDFGSHALGVDLGPSAIRHAHLVKILKNLGFRIVDTGNISISTKEKRNENRNLKYLNSILEFNKELGEKIIKGFKDNFFPVTLGGDHSISIGSISAVSKIKKNIGLIWIDAHPDSNTDKTTLTGNIHGMPLSSLLGKGYPKLVNFLFTGPKVKAENTVIIGAKDIDQAERKILKKLKVLMYTIDDIEEKGISEIVKTALKRISKNISHLHVSLDLDVIDIKDAPGVGMPNYGGLNYREISYITRKIGETSFSKSIDIVELNPTRDIENKTAKLAVELIVNLLGKRYSPYEAYLEENIK